MDEFAPIERSQLQAAIREIAPRPVQEIPLPDHRLRFIGGEPGEVVVELGPHDLTVASFTASADGTETPVVLPKLMGTVRWTEVPAVTCRRVLAELLFAAAALRRMSYQNCAQCGHSCPPEQMFDEQRCRKCMAADEQVVY